jgi:hypothetical protein
METAILVIQSITLAVLLATAVMLFKTRKDR